MPLIQLPRWQHLSSLLKTTHKSFWKALSLTAAQRGLRLKPSPDPWRNSRKGKQDCFFMRWCSVIICGLREFPTVSGSTKAQLLGKIMIHSVTVSRKFSFDLMTLTIREVSANLALVHNEISKVKEQLSSDFTYLEKMKLLLDDCEWQKNELSKEITASKKKKFERDAADYESVGIYWLRNPTLWKKQGNAWSRRARWNPSPTWQHTQQLASDLEHDTKSSAYSRTSNSFLDQGNTRKKEEKMPAGQGCLRSLPQGNHIRPVARNTTGTKCDQSFQQTSVWYLCDGIK